MGRKSFQDFAGDVYYDVWRSGGNPDAVDPDRIYGRYSDGWESDESAISELRRQREVDEQRRQEHEMEQQMLYEAEQYWAEYEAYCNQQQDNPEQMQDQEINDLPF